MLPNFLKPYNVDIDDLIRIGPNSDGGYVIHKESLNLTKKIITCGLNDDWKFEKNFKKLNKNCRIEAYDHTINNKFWYERFKKDIIHFFLLKKLSLRKIIKIFDYLDYKKFFKNENKHFLQKIVKKPKNNNEISLIDLIANDESIFLKIDIEGDEYDILQDINQKSENLISLVIEFHEIQKNLKLIENFITKVSNLKLIHIHANNFKKVDMNGNPNDIELTFINEKKIYISKKKIISKISYFWIRLQKFQKRKRY